ncbi:MAG: hypothetical protein F6K65_06460 [Moorea sp. SIO3C2]|nr:hypothetical protein [Moorena sp. SIO3C2]NES80790.1 hypothetical protein [Moorena sp. SIO2B7]
MSIIVPINPIIKLLKIPPEGVSSLKVTLEKISKFDDLNETEYSDRLVDIIEELEPSNSIPDGLNPDLLSLGRYGVKEFQDGEFQIQFEKGVRSSRDTSVMELKQILTSFGFEVAVYSTSFRSWQIPLNRS